MKQTEKENENGKKKKKITWKKAHTRSSHWIYHENALYSHGKPNRMTFETLLQWQLAETYEKNEKVKCRQPAFSAPAHDCARHLFFFFNNKTNAKKLHARWRELGGKGEGWKSKPKSKVKTQSIGETKRWNNRRRRKRSKKIIVENFLLFLHCCVKFTIELFHFFFF